VTEACVPVRHDVEDILTLEIKTVERGLVPVQQQFEDCKFTLHTNARLQCVLASCVGGTTRLSEEIATIVTTKTIPKLN
jgi:hypothetical protein